MKRQNRTILDADIAILRDRLNRLAAEGADPEKLYSLSVRLDRLILEYYRCKCR